MADPLEQARRELAAAQKNLAALESVPERDTYPVGTVIRWKGKDSRTARLEHGFRAAMKVRGGSNPDVECWVMTGHERIITWHYLRIHWKREMEFFEVATGWEDARTKPEAPAMVVQEKGWRLVDTLNHIIWERVGDEWVRVES